MGEKTSGIGDLISVPKGGGAAKGMGEKFSADLHTGTGNFSVPIALPPGRNGLQPSLTLGFSTGSGNSPFGLGWSLSVPGVSRLTSKGIPRYRDEAADATDRDTFVLSGAEDLVEVEEDRAAGLRRYRPRTEGLFARITHHRSDADHWVVETKDGLTSVYGSADASNGGDAARGVVTAPSAPTHVFAWRLTETRDLFGNRIAYGYRQEHSTDRGHDGTQLYLKHIRYVDLPEIGPDAFFVSVEFVYDDEPAPPGIEPEVLTRQRPDPFSEYRSGFEIRTRRRCKWIVVRTHPADQADPVLVRSYELIYLDEQTQQADKLPPNAASLLSRINVVGYDDAGKGHRELPPLDFGYSTFEPAARRFTSLQGKGLPLTSLANPDMELVDLFGHGLPDIVELGGTVVRYWRNLGGGRFDMPRSFADVPAGWKLSDTGVQLLDANGDGRADLLVTTAETAGYYPLDFNARFNPRSYQRYAQAPSFNLEDPEVRLIDLTGDGVTDVLRSGSHFECYFNHATEGWSPQRTARIQRGDLTQFPNVSFAEPRVKLADLSGDGLQDIAVVWRGRVDYWPNLGYGRFGARLTMAIPQGLPADYDPQRVILGDVDGDGLADLLYVSDREVTLWINCSGNGWSEPITIRGTPAVNGMVTVRLTDLHGLGVAGLLWTRDARGDGSPQHFFLDFTGGRKPYLLNFMDNHLGAQTRVTYASSTQSYLRDQATRDHQWRSTLPFPVQVVERVEVHDLFSDGRLHTEYRYHHGYWDGVEREFRGFGMVEQLDTNILDAYRGAGSTRNTDTWQRLVAQDTYVPPVLTRTWFHQGPVRPDDGGHWDLMHYDAEYWPGDPNQLQHVPAASRALRQVRDAQRALRGSILRSEVYALDGSPLADRPYTVTEHAYDVRQERTPDPTRGQPGIYFPFAVAERTTQWERGTDPLTQLGFTSGHDAWGQPARQLAIACPRGWRSVKDSAPAADYLATLSHTRLAPPPANGPYLCDRVVRSRSWELLDTQGKTVEALSLTDETSPSLRLIGEALTCYDGDASLPGGGAFTGLPLGQLGAWGVAVRSEALVMTERHLQDAYFDAIPGYLRADGDGTADASHPQGFRDALPHHAGYLLHAADADHTGGWYSITASKRCDFHDALITPPTSAPPPRGLLLAQRDPLGAEARILAYDAQRLLPTRVADAMGFETRATYCRRTLQPETVTDPNGNVTRLAYSPSGLVTDTWLLGKPEAGPDDRLNCGDRHLPSVHIEYGLRACYDSTRVDEKNAQPVYARAVRRVFHDSDPAKTDKSGETIEAREYSDGFGRLLQTRTQGEAVRFGDSEFGGGDDLLPADQDADLPKLIVGRENLDPDNPNVIVSGWQRYDGKGRVIEKFEPRFDTGWHYQPVTSRPGGAAVRMAYDVRGQLVRTLNPDRSEQLVIHGIPHNLDDPPLDPLDTSRYAPTPWEAYTYDGNDNAGRTHAGEEPHTRYRHHYNTPASITVDALGRTVRAVARHREAPEDISPWLNPSGVQPKMPDIEEHVTRSTYDIQGNLTGIRDALGRLAFEYIYDLAKHPLRTESIDAGRKQVVLDAAGNPLENRDAKGAWVLHSCDILYRPTGLWACDAKDEPVTRREQLFYDDDPEAPAAPAGSPHDRAQLLNLRGQLWRHHDEAGIVTVGAVDFQGRVARSTRQVLSDDFMLSNYRAHVEGTPWELKAPRIDWDAPWQGPPGTGWLLLDPMLYQTRTAYDALGRVVWSDYPQAANGERYRLRPDYNRAGALESVALIGPMDANDQGPSQTYAQRIVYNAKGQRVLITYGNGISTRCAYEPDTFRLSRMRTERWALPDASQPLAYKLSGPPLQDMAYWYDLAGNILGIQDVTPGCGVANNAESIHYSGDLAQHLSAGDALIRCFEYDPLYRLTSATGREAINIASPRPWSDVPRNGYIPSANGVAEQANAPYFTGLYWEEYAYDPAGNMLTMRHSKRVGGNNGGGWQTAWSRRFGMDGRTPDAWCSEAVGRVTGDWIEPPSNCLTHVEDRGSGTPASASAQQSHWYDATGNMVQEHTERHFEWDHADRMQVFRNQVDASRPTTYAVYLYDSFRMRVKKLVINGGNGYRTTTYLGSAFEHHSEQKLDGGDKVENCTLHVVDDKSRIAIVRVGPTFDENGAKEYPVQYHIGDHLASIGLAMSLGGKWINREEFFPFGETSFGSFVRKRFRYTGKEKDVESGLNYHGARYLSFSLARWINCDPSGSAAGVNLFEFVAGNPIVNIDDTGLQEVHAGGQGGVDTPQEKKEPSFIVGVHEGFAEQNQRDMLNGGVDNLQSLAIFERFLGRVVGVFSESARTSLENEANRLEALANKLLSALPPPRDDPAYVFGQALSVGAQSYVEAKVELSKYSTPGNVAPPSTGAQGPNVSRPQSQSSNGPQKNPTPGGERIFYVAPNGAAVAVRTNGNAITFDTPTDANFVGLALQRAGEMNPGTHIHVGSGTHGNSSGGWAANAPALAEPGFVKEDLATTAAGSLPSVGVRSVINVGNPSGAASFLTLESAAANAPPGTLQSCAAWCFSTYKK